MGYYNDNMNGNNFGMPQWNGVGLYGGMNGYSSSTDTGSDNAGYYAQIADALGLDNAEQVGGLFGGLGNLGTGLFQMYQGNNMMDMYEKNMKAQVRNAQQTNYANATMYNNQLSRGATERARHNGGKDPMKTINAEQYRLA